MEYTHFRWKAKAFCVLVACMAFALTAILVADHLTPFAETMSAASDFTTSALYQPTNLDEALAPMGQDQNMIHARNNAILPVAALVIVVTVVAFAILRAEKRRHIRP